MNRKVLISTIDMFFMLSNYGTFFQHLSLRRQLERLGFSCVRWRFGKKTPTNFLWFLKRYENYARIVYWMLSSKERHKFFLRNCLPDYSQKTLFRADFNALIGEFDEDVSVRDDSICLMGSDQVLSGYEDTWFANVRQNVKRIIYAGSADWVACSRNRQWESLVRKELPRFSAVSIRESAGVEICRRYAAAGVEVAHVLDPVFLEGGMRLASIASERQVLPGNVLLCYLVNVEDREGLHVKELEDLAMRLGCQLKMLGIQGAAGYIPPEYRLILSPREFIRAYLDARYVITNSFHGTAFALMFHKLFISVKQSCKEGTDQNLRQHELLTWLDLSRFHMSFGQYDGNVWAKLMESGYDVHDLDGRIEAKRADSESWLKNALMG